MDAQHAELVEKIQQLNLFLFRESNATLHADCASSDAARGCATLSCLLCGFISLTHLGRVPLHRVSQGGHWQRVMAKSSLEIARLVISGADVNAAHIEGCAPPHVTA
jgi:hypothetical protein